MLTAVSGSADEYARLRVSVPFDFAVGTATLEAGEYIVTRVDARGTFLISGLDSRGRVFAFSRPVQAKFGQETSPMLIFNRYGNQYFLAQVWNGGQVDGHQFRKTAKERQAAGEVVAKNATEPELVVIAAR